MHPATAHGNLEVFTRIHAAVERRRCQADCPKGHATFRPGRQSIEPLPARDIASTACRPDTYHAFVVSGGEPALALLELLGRELVPREQLVEVGTVAPCQSRGLAHVATGDLQDLRQIAAGELIARLIEGWEPPG